MRPHEVVSSIDEMVIVLAEQPNPTMIFLHEIAVDGDGGTHVQHLFSQITQKSHSEASRSFSMKPYDDGSPSPASIRRHSLCNAETIGLNQSPFLAHLSLKRASGVRGGIEWKLRPATPTPAP